MVITVMVVVQSVCSTMDHHSARLLLLLLTCLAGFSASETEESGAMGESSYGPSSLVIEGVDVVTVGIPYGFQCRASCPPGCRYSWTRGNVTSQGPELSLQLLHILPTQTLTCTAVNPATGKSASVHKRLLVTAGPSNVQITGPDFLTIGAESIFTCSATCYPSCSYTWTVIWQGENLQTKQGNTISVTPARDTVFSESLLCQAEDTVSHLYISTIVSLPVAAVSDIHIDGYSTVTMGKQYMYTCWALCNPTLACTFTWKYMGKTFKGEDIEIPILHQGDKKKSASQLEITFSDYSKIEPLTCEATNTLSHATITTTLDLTVIDPISVRPTSQDLPVADKSFSLQCVGSQNPASITWLKNKNLMPTSERVHFSPDNMTLTFSPLLQGDEGLYQCVVAQGGPSIQSVGYEMQVIYGPSSVVITGVDIMTARMPYDFQCSASCYPPCLFTWTSANMTSLGPKLRLLPGEQPPTQILTCRAVNPDTGASVTAQKTLQVTAGPTNVQISGPAFLTAGVSSTFTCSADCYSSCSYSWTVAVNEQTLSTARGKTISFIPSSSTVASETLICQAEDASLHLSIYKTLQLQVASVSNINITGPSAVAMGKSYTYVCSASCNPFCVFTWKFLGKTLYGDQIQIPYQNLENINTFGSKLEIKISDYFKDEPLTCEAVNTESNATISTSMNLTVMDPFAVRPTSQAPPTEGEPFSLRCVGPQAPASITWLKNHRHIRETEFLHFSSDNTTITFSSLLREDGGLYQCLVVESGNRTIYYNSLVVIESGTPILSAGYLLRVNYGPGEVLIVKPNKVPVGRMLFVESGSTTELQCSADCFPVCSINWFYHGALLSTNATIYFTPVTPPQEAPLTCVASNSATRKNGTAETTVVVPDGPKNVVIKGPNTVEVGVTSSFTCSAECTPSCTFKWTLYGKTMTGSVIDITLNSFVSGESISCQVENVYTGKTATVNETLSVSDPQWCGC